ncbi:hypothetical protein Mh1961_13790 [Mannheimia haemolytica]
MKKLLKWLLIVFVVIPVVLGTLVGIFQNKNQNTENVASNNQKEVKNEGLTQANLEQKIEAGAFLPMTKKSYPKAYKLWGQDGFNRINKLGPLAAELVAKSKQCDKVIDVSLSDAKSNPKSYIVFFVDCKNKERFFVSESDIEFRHKAISLNEEFKNKNINASNYYNSCLKGIKARANFPATVDSSVFDRQIGPSTTGGVIVMMKFSARNAFGVEENFIAQCDYYENKSDIRISKIH